MTEKPNLYQKISLQLSNSNPDTVSEKIRRVKYYFNDTRNKDPEIKLQDFTKQKLMSTLKDLFNQNKGILIVKSNYPYKNCLLQNNFQAQIQKSLQEFIDSLKEGQKKGSNLINFLQFWFQNKPNTTVFYEKYSDLLSDLVQGQLEKMYQKLSEQMIKGTSKHTNKKIQGKDQNQKKQQLQHINKQQKIDTFQIQKPSELKDQQKEQTVNNQQQYQNEKIQQSDNQSSQYFQTSKKTTRLSHNPQKTDPFNYFLYKFYDHYCKKYLNTIKNQQFEKLGKFYNSMNLNKFMMYCKDLKLLKIQKKLTATYLQQLFKLQQNQTHCIQYESFAKIVKKCLEQAFETQQRVENEGYRLIGVLNRENFSQVMGKIGVLIPVKKTLMPKPELLTKQEILLRKSRSKDNQILKKSRLLKDGSMNGHGHESHWDSNNLHPELFLNQKERKQQQLLQNLTIPKLNRLQPSKFVDQKLNDIIDQQYDPYLKRFNQKSIHQNSSGVLKRMDERINNIVKKIR